MKESVYKVIEVIGSSPTSWEQAAKIAVQRASKTLKDLRVAEVAAMDIHLANGKTLVYRVRLKVSFKHLA